MQQLSFKRTLDVITKDILLLNDSNCSYCRGSLHSWHCKHIKTYNQGVCGINEQKGLFIPKGLAEPEGGYRFTRCPGVRPWTKLEQRPSMLESCNFGPMCIFTVRPDLSWIVLKKFKMADLWAKTRKNEHLLGESVALNPAKPAACSHLIFCEILMSYFVMMHAILQCCNNFKMADL